MSMFALMLAATTPAVQDYTPLQKDARCVVALQRMIETPEVAANKDGKAAVTGVMLFYLGRLSTRVAPNQMEGAINSADETLSASEHKSHALACIEEMRTLSGVNSMG